MILDLIWIQVKTSFKTKTKEFITSGDFLGN